MDIAATCIAQNYFCGRMCFLHVADARQRDHGPKKSMPVELGKQGIQTGAELLCSFGK